MKIQTYKSKYKEQKEISEALRQKRDEYKDKWYDEQIKTSHLENKIDSLEYQNKKLVEWIMKIINDVGIYEINKNNTIQIPIIKKDKDIWQDGFDKPYTKSEITLPEIHISKMEFKGGNYESYK